MGCFFITFLNLLTGRDKPKNQTAKALKSFSAFCFA